MRNYLYIILLSLAARIITGSYSVVVTIYMTVLFGILLINILADKKNKSAYHKIFNQTFSVYLTYAIICYIYMKQNNYQTLLVTDSITSYIPYTKEFMQMDSFEQMWNEIYHNTILKYQHVGIITIYFTLFGNLASVFDQELYMNLQISIILMSSFVNIFVYKLLKSYEIHNAYKYTLFFGFSSIFFYYSTLILRDVPIVLCYVITFCYMVKKFNIKSVIVIISTSIIAFGIRPQSGLFLLCFLLILFINKDSQLKTIFLMIIPCALIFYVFSRFDAQNILEETQNHSEMLLREKAQTSTLNSLNKLPVGISTIAKLIFIQISPIPCWAFMGLGRNANETSNIMGFPRAIAVLYNMIILFITSYGLFSFRKYRIPKKMWYSTLLSILFICLQTDTIELRRVMACFPLLLLFSAWTFNYLEPGMRKQIVSYAIFSFLIFQILGLTKYI